MSLQKSLNKIMFLSMFSFMILILFTIFMSEKLIYKNNNPIYSEYVNFLYQGENYNILLHTINTNGNPISAYSKKHDSILQFLVNNNDLVFFNNLITSYNYKLQSCNNCHRNIKGRKQ